MKGTAYCCICQLILRLNSKIRVFNIEDIFIQHETYFIYPSITLFRYSIINLGRLFWKNLSLVNDKIIHWRARCFHTLHFMLAGFHLVPNTNSTKKRAPRLLLNIRKYPHEMFKYRELQFTSSLKSQKENPLSLNLKITNYQV